MFSKPQAKPAFKYQVMTILWLSFVMAGIATGVFFSIVDPLTLQPCVSNLPDISRTAAYSVGFLLFWLLTASSCLLSHMFLGVDDADENKAD